MEEITNVENMLSIFIQTLSDDRDKAVQLQKERVSELIKANNILSSQLQASYPQTSNSLISMTSAFMVTQKSTCPTLQASDQSLRNTLQQIKKLTDTLEQRMSDEAKRFREALNKILYLEAVFIKPYDDVELATGDLQQKIEQMIVEKEKEKLKAIDFLSGNKKTYTALCQDISNFQTVKNELSSYISNLQGKVSEKLNYLDLESTSDIKTIISKEEELKKEITELREKYNNSNSS